MNSKDCILKNESRNDKSIALEPTGSSRDGGDKKNGDLASLP